MTPQLQKLEKTFDRPMDLVILGIRYLSTCTLVATPKQVTYVTKSNSTLGLCVNCTRTSPSVHAVTAGPFRQCYQCDQIGQFIGLWATF